MEMVIKLDYDGIEPIETTSKQINDDGKKEWKFKAGKYKVTAVYNNHLSEEAIKTANLTYNELFNKFNPQLES